MNTFKYLEKLLKPKQEETRRLVKELVISMDDQVLEEKWSVQTTHGISLGIWFPEKSFTDPEAAQRYFDATK